MLIGWAEIPELSTCVGCCSAPWLQSWLQSRRNGADPRPSACQVGIRRPGRVGPARALGKLAWSVARSPRASGGTRCTRPGRTSVRRRIRVLIRVAHRLSLGLCCARGCWWPRWRRLSRATGGSFRRKCAALLTGSGSGVRFRSEQGKSLNPRGFSGFSPSSARAAGWLRRRRVGPRWLIARYLHGGLPLFRPDISPVGADHARVMRCCRSLLAAVGRCCHPRDTSATWVLGPRPSPRRTHCCRLFAGREVSRVDSRVR
jgi:hypothetical protein